MRPLRSRKGIVGIEAAIVLIAFVVIAAALSYVVINMGFFATQKTKETINEGIEESTSALQLDGTVMAKTNDTSAVIQYIVFPVKLSVGKAALDLGTNTTVVSIYLPDATLLDIYENCSSTAEKDVETLMTGVASDTARFFIYNGDGDTSLEYREKAFLVVHLGDDHRPADYDILKIEVKTGVGATLTVVRTAPGGMNADSYVDLS